MTTENDFFGELPETDAPATEGAKRRGRPPKAVPESDVVEVKAAEPTVALSEAELDDIRQKARKIVAKEQREKLLEEALQKAIDEEKYLAGLPTEGPPPAISFEDIYISLPEFSHAIILDGKRFYHGYSAKVSPQQAAMLRYQMQLSWAHEEERQGNSRYAHYRRPRNPIIGPSKAVINGADQFRGH